MAIPTTQKENTSKRTHKLHGLWRFHVLWAVYMPEGYKKNSPEKILLGGVLWNPEQEKRFGDVNVSFRAKAGGTVEALAFKIWRPLASLVGTKDPETEVAPRPSVDVIFTDGLEVLRETDGCEPLVLIPKTLEAAKKIQLKADKVAPPPEGKLDEEDEAALALAWGVDA